MHQGGQPTPIDHGLSFRYDLLRNEVHDPIGVYVAITVGWRGKVEVFGHRLAMWLVAAVCTEREAFETVGGAERATGDQCRAPTTPYEVGAVSAAWTSAWKWCTPFSRSAEKRPRS